MKYLTLCADASSMKYENGALCMCIPSGDRLEILRQLGDVADSDIDQTRTVGVEIDDDLQAEVFRVLKPLGKVVFDQISTRELGQDLATDLKIQGFCDISVAKDETGRFVYAQKPADLVIGSSASVSIPLSTKPKTTVWSMNASDLAEDDLVDEDDLLDDGIVVDGNDCGPDVEGQKKRACKNCSCGLADQEAEEAKAAITGGPVKEVMIKSSACGNCSKGDAFRCAGCPFLGKPTFEAGQEKLVLGLVDDI